MINWTESIGKQKMHTEVQQEKLVKNGHLEDGEGDELHSFRLESYCHILPASFLSSFYVRYQILQVRTGLLNNSEICCTLIFLVQNVFFYSNCSLLYPITTNLKLH
jgi:hypothetical protein